jgi:hypothetical protein
MARRSRPSFTKRQKEMARQQKQQEKDARRLELKQQKAAQPASETSGEDDPEIAGIRPGPQPPPAWMEPPQRKP